MGELATDPLSDPYMEILPPKSSESLAPAPVACLCCRKLYPAASMDDDGCGMCDECLAP